MESSSLDHEWKSRVKQPGNSDCEISESNSGPLVSDADSFRSYMEKNISLGPGEILKNHIVKQIGNEKIHTLIIHSDNPDKFDKANKSTSFRGNKRPPVTSNNDKSEVKPREEEEEAPSPEIVGDNDQLEVKPREEEDAPSPVIVHDGIVGERMRMYYKKICYRRLADLGVPLPPGMVLTKSSSGLIRVLRKLVAEGKMLVILQGDQSAKGYFTISMMPLAFAVILIVCICNPYYSSLGLGLLFWCVYVLCTLTYLGWLTYTEKLMEKHQLNIAQVVLKKRKELPMVEFDNVEADEYIDKEINDLCYMATEPFIVSYCWIYSALVVGILGIVLCGCYY